MANFEISQSSEILSARKTQSYPIQKEEWAHIKDKINLVGRGDDFFHSTGFLLVGGGISGIFAVVPQPTFGFYWVLTVCCFICGLLCLRFTKTLDSTQEAGVDNIIEYMEIIEEKFIDPPPPSSPAPIPSVNPRDVIKDVITQNPEKTAAEIADLSKLDRATVAGYISSLYQAGEIVVSGTGRPKKFKIK
jgi:hypothetical protein